MHFTTLYLTVKVAMVSSLACWQYTVRYISRLVPSWPKHVVTHYFDTFSSLNFILCRWHGFECEGVISLAPDFMSVPSKDTLEGLLWAPCVSPSKGPSTLYVCSGKSFACELHSRREWLQLSIPCVETDTNTYSKIHLEHVFSLAPEYGMGKNGNTALIWRRWLCEDPPFS